MRFFRPGKGAPERGHTHYVRMMPRDVSQLFNSMDPSPFIERDLDAEEFMVSWAQEFPRDDPIRLHNLPGTVARPEGGGPSCGTQLFCAPRSDCGIGLGGCCEGESNDCRMGDHVGGRCKSIFTIGGLCNVAGESTSLVICGGNGREGQELRAKCFGWRIGGKRVIFDADQLFLLACQDSTIISNLAPD